ncbi:MAG: hypothetical protein ABSD56_15650 [Bryobacteraceae bacterium]
MISFRLSEEEYDAVRALCQSNGVRSISDFARLAIEIQLASTDGHPPEAVQSRLDVLTSQIRVLDLAVGRLADLVAAAGNGREES